MSGTKLVDGAPVKNGWAGRYGELNRRTLTTDHSLVRNVGYDLANRAAYAMILSFRNDFKLETELVIATDTTSSARRVSP